MFCNDCKMYRNEWGPVDGVPKEPETQPTLDDDDDDYDDAPPWETSWGVFGKP